MKASIIVISILASAACAPVQSPTVPEPIKAFEGYSRSLAQGDLQSAYTFLGPEYTDNLPFDAFERLFERHGDAMKREAAALLQAMGASAPREEVWVTLGNQKVRLIRTQRGWRLTDTMKSSDQPVQ